ncbi:hypothetical protein PPACK8108_LOCUS8369, partial [Phakopsora pachyrhizi]
SFSLSSFLLFPPLSHPSPWQLLLLLADADSPVLRHPSAQLLIPLRIVCPRLWSCCSRPLLLWRPSPLPPCRSSLLLTTTSLPATSRELRGLLAHSTSSSTNSD